MNKIAVIFIHGLKGNSDTWVNDSGESLQNLLCSSDADISNHCDFFEYNYFSEITEFMNGFVAKQSFNFMKKIPLLKFAGNKYKNKKVRTNKTISQLSSGLESEIRARFSNHKEIILIGHSMGGLVAKSLILSQLQTNNLQNIKAYISIATPHHGSLNALFLKFSNNKHAKELQPLNEQTMLLEKVWGKNKAKLPLSRYLVALDDEVVTPHCATPNGAEDTDIFMLNEEDHTSICKPDDINSTSFMLVKEIINDRLSRMLVKNTFEDNKKEKIESYTNSIFVIKLIIADVNKTLVDSSKTSFFKAEISSRVNKKHLEQLNSLYDKIEFIYQQEFYLFEKGKIDSSELVYKVHNIIKNDDSTVLQSALESISFLEKIGMLHQMANSIDKNIVWCNEDLPEVVNGKT
ncbi:ABC-three component system protein [Moritella sp.]|uniref:ABC-three component system protein n=1 Tax=Moritella sp. TaxID=78556 RepID=UPI0025D3010E|nr:ABC-three component system protein [Moritella sp.]MCJ8351920.1 hypothetical protein [Moritella sp.]